MRPRITHVASFRSTQINLLQQIQRKGLFITHTRFLSPQRFRTQFPSQRWRCENMRKNGANPHLHHKPCKAQVDLQTSRATFVLVTFPAHHRSKRARPSLIKHPDCLVSPYYHLNLPTASQVRPEAHSPDSKLTSLSWLIDPGFGATGRRPRAWSSAELSADHCSQMTPHSTAAALWLSLLNVLSRAACVSHANAAISIRDKPNPLVDGKGTQSVLQMEMK